MLKVLDGTPCPEEADVDRVNAWKKANTNIYSILYFHTEGSTNITVRAHVSTEVGCLGDGVAAWKALKERFDGNTKESRRACREKQFTTTMPSGGHPIDFISTMDDLQLRLSDMWEQILDDTHAHLMLNSFPKEFAFIRQMHHRDRSFTLEQIKQPPSTFTSTSFRDVPHTIVAAGQHVLQGVPTGTVQGTVIDDVGRETFYFYFIFLL